MSQMVERRTGEAENPAKRGMVVVLERTRRDYYIGGPTTSTTSYTLAEVTSVTRAKVVKAVRELGWSGTTPIPLDRIHGLDRWYIVGDVAVADAEAVAKANTYPNSTTPRAFESLDAVRDALRPFRQ